MNRSRFFAAALTLSSCVGLASCLVALPALVGCTARVPEHAHDHDHSDHDHSGHDHSGHDHSGHDHSGHDHDGDHAHTSGEMQSADIVDATRSIEELRASLATLKARLESGEDVSQGKLMEIEKTLNSIEKSANSVESRLGKE